MSPADALSEFLKPLGVKRLGLAVSGGGDSTAMLHLVVEQGLAETIEVATVDHGLRSESASEAATVAEQCASLGLRHETLLWRWDGQGNLQAAARAGRQRLLARWARERGLEAVALAHTQDDVAETFLMRLSRGSGLAGLSVMAADFEVDGFRFLRPLLQTSRAALRNELTARKVAWTEDPSNQDDRFLRPKTRRALKKLGIDVPRIADTATRLADAHEVLEQQTDHLARRTISQTRDGTVRIALERFATAPQALRFGLVAELIRHLNRADYPPRAESVERVLSLALDQTTTLAGWIITHTDKAITLNRESAKTPSECPYTPGLWDTRWLLRGAPDGKSSIAPLGESGLAQRDWRASGLSRRALLTTPALFSDETLLISPILDPNPMVTATLLPPWPLEKSR